jgi:hypothetical protein
MRACLIALLCATSIPIWCAAPEARLSQKTVRIPVVDAGDITFTAISTPEGLSQVRVTSIVQDGLGFMWFGTQYGLKSVRWLRLQGVRA